MNLRKQCFNMFCVLDFVCVKTKKHIPLHLRRQARLQKLTSAIIFELLPSSGMLYPGERVNIQVKFSPAEGVRTARCLCLTSSQIFFVLHLMCKSQTFFWKVITSIASLMTSIDRVKCRS